MSEIAGDMSDESFEAERRMYEEMGVEGLPGIGMSAEVNQSLEHRYCPKCGKWELRTAAKHEGLP